MKDSPKNIKWHPAFCSAAKVEMREDAEYLTLEAEHYISKEPIRIDLLIIKDEALKSGIKNEIGHIMRKYNIIEYKSPKDELNIDDYYKTVGYASLYKGYGENVDIIPADELTVSLFRARHPQKLMNQLKADGNTIEQVRPGIYYVTGNVLFPTQIVVTQELTPELHSALRILTDSAKREDVERFLNESREYKSQGERNDIKSVLEASVDANKQLYDEIRRCSGMGTLDEWLDEAERKGEVRGISQGISQGELQGKEKKQRQVIFNMYRDNFTLQQIARVVDLSIDAVKQILNSDNKMKI